MKNNTHNTKRARVVAAGCLVVATLGITAFGATGSAASNPTQPPTAIDQSAVAEWAGTTGISGMSPASLQNVPEQSTHAVDLSAVAEWAEANGLSGLSPASVSSPNGSDGSK